MNKAVRKLPLMLGIVGAIAFAAATPSWAAEKGSAGGGAQAQTQVGAKHQATGKMSARSKAGVSTKTSMGRSGSSEGIRGGKKLSKRSRFSSQRDMHCS